MGTDKSYAEVMGGKAAGAVKQQVPQVGDLVQLAGTVDMGLVSEIQRRGKRLYYVVITLGGARVFRPDDLTVVKPAAPF